MTAADVFARSPVIPVAVVQHAARAVELARALLAGGVSVLEITLRTPAALDAIRAVRAEAPGMLVGAGTVLTAADMERAIEAGAGFVVSPGATPALLAAGRSCSRPFIPGAATASEVMLALEHGYDHLKFFPAEASGGRAALAALAGPFPQVRFCPTGGIGAANAADYLALRNVECVGATWLAEPALVEGGRWAEITARARAAAALTRGLAGQSVV